MRQPERELSYSRKGLPPTPIPVSETTADRLVAGHERAVAPETNRTNGTIHQPNEQDIQKLFTSVWPKLAKALTTPESVYDFVRCIITRSGIAHECLDEGIFMFHPTVAAQADVPPVEPARGNFGVVV
jgi:hypothetical protein